MDFQSLGKLLNNHLVKLLHLLFFCCHIFDDFQALIVQEEVANLFDSFSLFVLVLLLDLVDVILKQQVLDVLVRSRESLVLAHFVHKLAKSDSRRETDHLLLDQGLEGILVLLQDILFFATELLK